MDALLDTLLDASLFPLNYISAAPVEFRQPLAWLRSSMPRLADEFPAGYFGLVALPVLVSL